MQPVAHPMRRRVMRLLGAPLGDAGAVADEIGADGAWPEVLGLCERWKVLPALAGRVKEAGIRLPPADAAELRRSTAIQFVRTTRCLRAGLEAMGWLESAGIPAVAFKGCAVIAQLYPGPGDRMVQDVDLLIRERDLASALAVVGARGYARQVGDGSMDEYRAFVRHSPGAAGNEAVSLSSGQGNHVDLHWKLGAFDVDELLGTARRVRFLNTEARLVRPAFGILLTVHHALRNDFVPDEMARDILDSVRWFRLMGADPGEWACAVGQASRLGLVDGLGAMAGIVAALGWDVPGWRGDNRARAGALEGLYFHQLDHGALSTDLGYLASGRALGQILSGLRMGWGRYVRHMRGFEAANGEESPPMWERARRLAVAAGGTRPAQWRQIRALARAQATLR